MIEAKQEGIDIKRGEGGAAVFPFGPLDSTGVPITEGDATVYLFEIQEDGSLYTLDFGDNTFKADSCAQPTSTASPQTAGGMATGIFTFVLSEDMQTDFEHGKHYVLYATHESMTAPYRRWFQWGGVEGDMPLDIDERIRRSRG
jgi:hypothetical protein